MDFIYVPFAWILEQFYNLSGNYIAALFLFAFVFKLVLLPSAISQQKGAAKQQRLQPKIRRIQARYAGDQKKIQEEMQALYAREGYSPMNAQGCLPLLIQLPIIYILYEVIYKPLTYVVKLPSDVITNLNGILESMKLGASNKRYIEMNILGNFDKVAEKVPEYAAEIREFIDGFSLFGIPLTTEPSLDALKGTDTGAKLLLLVPLFSGLTALLTSLITHVRQKKQNPEMSKNPMMGCMTFVMPIMSLVFTFQFPAGIGIYWIFQNILSVIQMVVLNRVYSNEKVLSKVLVVETIQRRSKENNIKMVSKIKDKE